MIALCLLFITFFCSGFVFGTAIEREANVRRVLRRRFGDDA